MTDPMYPLSFLNNRGRTILPYEVFAFDYDRSFTSTTPNARGRMVTRSGGSSGGTTDTCSDWPNPDSPSLLGKANRMIAINSSVPTSDGNYGKCTTAYDGLAWARIRDDDTFPDKLRESDVDYLGWELGPGDSCVSAEGFGFMVMGSPDFSNSRILVSQLKPETPFKAIAICRSLQGCEDSEGNVDDNLLSYPLNAIPLRRCGAYGHKICSAYPNSSDQFQFDRAARINITPSPTGCLEWGPLPGFVGSEFNPCELDLKATLATVQWNGAYYETISGGRTVLEGVLHVDGDSKWIENPTECCNVKLPVDLPCDLVLPDETYVYCLWDSVKKRLKVYDFCCPPET